MEKTAFIERGQDLLKDLEERSVFLYGPRQTGKSRLAAHILPQDTYLIDLLDPATLVKFSQSPSLLQAEVEQRQLRNTVVMIDEIQRLPSLLDEVHRLIENRGIRFLLTGSSARRLKQAPAGDINLLGGRARERYLHPFSFIELGEEHFDLRRALNIGLLPPIYFSKDPRADLASYVGTYLGVEISQEARLRKLDSFSRFLKIAALESGRMINFKNISNDAKVPAATVASYYQILKDTRFCHELPAWKKGRKRKAFETAKFYFFDSGVARSLNGQPFVKEGSGDFGDAFEAYIFHEIKTYLDYRNPYTELSYWRSTSGFEVDFLLGNETAIEVKAKKEVPLRDLSGLEALSEEGVFRRFIVVSLEPNERRISLKGKKAGNAATSDLFVDILPWKKFLEYLWSGALITKDEEV